MFNMDKISKKIKYNYKYKSFVTFLMHITVNGSN